MKIGIFGCAIGPGLKNGRHQIEAVELALKLERRSVLPTFPDGAQREHHFTQLRTRRFELHRETPLVMRPHLRPEPKNKSSRRRFLNVPGGIGNHHGTARKRHGNRGPELDGRGRGRRHCQRQKRVVLGLGCPETAVANCFDLARVLGNRLEIVVAQRDVQISSTRLFNA